MVREFTELQGTMGGIYAREEGMPEEVWKAIYFHYLPVGVEADAPPTKAQLGKAAVTWAAVSLADKLDTIVGLFVAGEKPTGSRDPYGLRRAAQGVLKILVDQTSAGDLVTLIDAAYRSYPQPPDDGNTSWRAALFEFFKEREAHLLERRGYRPDEVRAVTYHWAFPREALRRLEALAQVRSTLDFVGLAVLFKRVKNITKDFKGSAASVDELRQRLKEPAELALVDALARTQPGISEAIERGRYADAMRSIAGLREPVDRFFIDVLVMADDEELREARLTLLTTLKQGIQFVAGDISEIAPDETKQA
jgi:glycyl-tRNA synthetase beta chain